MMNRRSAIITMLASCAPIAWARTQESRYPNGIVKVIVPYAPGGNADGVARLYASAMQDTLHETFIVENKSGASGAIGARDVVRSPADGHTLLMTASSQLYNRAPGPDLGYDPIKDFTPVAGLTVNPLLLGVPTSLGVNSLEELVQRAKSEKLAYGSFGVGNVTHVLLHVFDQQIGANMTHVPYRGENPLMVDMLGGQVQVGLFSPSVLAEMERTGKMRALATQGVKRSEFLPNVPTFAEQGFKDLDWPFASVVFATSNTPTALLQQIEAKSLKAVESQAIRDAFRQRSSEYWGASAAEVRESMASTIEKWPGLVARLGKLE